MSDPTDQIAPAEADIGFKKLFQDRYWRLLGIARRRPDSRNISNIESMKGQEGRQDEDSRPALSEEQQAWERRADDRRPDGNRAHTVQ